MVKEIAGKIFKVEFIGSENVIFIQAIDLQDAHSQLLEIERCGDKVKGMYLLTKNGFEDANLR